MTAGHASLTSRVPGPQALSGPTPKALSDATCPKTSSAAQAGLAGIPLVGTCIAAFQNIYVSREAVNRGKGAGRGALAGAARPSQALVTA